MSISCFNEDAECKLLIYRSSKFENYIEAKS